MSRLLRILVCAGLICALSSLGWQAEAVKRGEHLSRDEVATTWIGVSDDELYTLRLNLNLDGTGDGAFQFLDEQPRFFTIQSWQYSSGKIEIYPEKLKGAPSWLGQMNGAVAGLTMSLERAEDQWAVRFYLRQEEALLEKWQLLKESMESVDS